MKKITSVIAEMWSKMSDGERQPYLEKAEQDSKRYKEEMEEYVKTDEYREKQKNSRKKRRIVKARAKTLILVRVNKAADADHYPRAAEHKNNNNKVTCRPRGNTWLVVENLDIFLDIFGQRLRIATSLETFQAHSFQVQNYH